jgi:large subunit ribosomal protein L2
MREGALGREAGQEPDQGKDVPPAAATPAAAHRAPSRRGGAKRRYRADRSSSDQGRDPARVAFRRVRPQPLGEHRAASNYADGEKRSSSPRRGCRVGAEGRLRRGRGHRTRATRCPWRVSRPAPVVHNVELIPGQGGRLGRARRHRHSGGGKGGAEVSLRLPSSRGADGAGRVAARTVGDALERRAPERQGRQGGPEPSQGQAPADTCVAMNPVDHPHGGGKRAHHTPAGPPRHTWGKPTLGYRTRKKGKRSDALIVRGRAEERGSRWDARPRRARGPRNG